MKLPCPICQQLAVIDCLHVYVSHRAIHIRRRRQCRKCKARFSTLEEITATRSGSKEKPPKTLDKIQKNPLMNPLRKGRRC